MVALKYSKYRTSAFDFDHEQCVALQDSPSKQSVRIDQDHNTFPSSWNVAVVSLPRDNRDVITSKIEQSLNFFHLLYPHCPRTTGRLIWGLVG